jgi:hyperosmotically inducible periplasmic protein
MKRHWHWFLSLAALAMAACDREAQDAVKQAGTEIKREAKEAGAEAKHALREVGETTGQVLEDSAITAKVKAALHADKDVKSRDIDVETFQGKVVIKGIVPDRAQADLAAKVVASVEGVKAVENRLTVD